mgnify:CR=1 FL=1
MATKAPKEAVLISPAGDEYVPGSPAEANDLIYGHGYRPKAKVSAEEVAAAADPDAAGVKGTPKTSK